MTDADPGNAAPIGTHSPGSAARHRRWGLSSGRMAAAVVLGAGLGFGASASNAWPSPLIYILNAGWAWAAIFVLGGLLARRAPGGMVTALVSAATACVTYFLGDSWWAGASRPGLVARESFGYYLPELGLWLLLALLLAPGLGAIGVWLRRPDLLGLLTALVVPVGASLEMLLPRRWGDTAGPGEEAVRWLVWIASAGVAAWAVRRYLTSRRQPPADTAAPSPSRRQTALVTGLVCLSLTAGIVALVLGTGTLERGHTDSGLTAAQSAATVIARVRIVDSSTDGTSATDRRRRHRGGHSARLAHRGPRDRIPLTAGTGAARFPDSKVP